MAAVKPEQFPPSCTPHLLPRHLCDCSVTNSPQDTIDLQDHDAPSAKDHRHHTPGTHQSETLREVDRETAHEQQRSPRLSWTDPDSQEQQKTEDLVSGVQAKMAQEDALAVAQNGGVSSSDEGEGDGDELDDDLMDRISSSPSIEDGVYRPRHEHRNNVTTGEARSWPKRVDSLPEHLRASAAVLWGSPSSVGSSAYTGSPVHFPLGTHHLSADDNEDDEKTYHHDPDEEMHARAAVLDTGTNASLHG